MLSKKVLALLIPALFSGMALADTDPSKQASGQITFTGEVTAVTCQIHIPQTVTLQNVGQAVASSQAGHQGETRNFAIALQNCSFQTAGTVHGDLTLSDAGAGSGGEDSDPTLVNIAGMGDDTSEAARGVGVQIIYRGTSASGNPQPLSFLGTTPITMTDVQFSDETAGTGGYKFHFDAAIKRHDTADVYAGAVKSVMDVAVEYR